TLSIDSRTRTRRHGRRLAGRTCRWRGQAPRRSQAAPRFPAQPHSGRSLCARARYPSAAHPPRIARLYDAGISDRGQPYLALVYVEGEKITACCEQRNLGSKPRLQLFLQVLRAVQYAHSNLIVHRDLTPANILV